MRNSKFLLTSLLAAATMSATAWADEITSDGRTISTDTSADQIYFSASGTLTIDAGAALTITGSTAKAESDVSAAADRSSFSFGNTSRATINVNGTLNLLEASGFGTVWGTMGMIVGNGGVANLKALTVSSNYYNNNGSSVTLETGGTLNLGGGGYKKQYVGSGYADGSIDLTLNGGTLGALDSWSTSDALTASGDVTINTTKYDATNKAYLSDDGAGATISANGGLAGTGKFIISGLGSVSTTNVSVASLEIASGASMTISGALSSASVTNAGTLDLSGVSVTGLTSEIVNTGTITVSNGTIFNLTDALKNDDGSYTLISNSGSGNITNWTADILSATNFTLDGKLLSGRTQITLGAGSVTLSGEAYNLFWKGGDGSWDTATAANFGKDSVSGDDTAFVAGDNVTFSSSATVAVSEGIRADVVSITGTVDAPTTLTLTNQANLTANSIAIGDNATLALGDFTSGGTVNHKLVGTGTVSLAKTTAGHSLSINIGTEFAGTVDFSGNLEFGGAVLGSSSAKLNLTDVHLWSGSGTTKTLEQAITFNGANNKFGGSGINGTLNLTGGVTFSEGAVLTMTTGGTLNISGSMEGADISQSGGTLNITLSSNSTVKSLTQTSGTFEIVGASDMSLEFTGTSTIKSLTVKSDWNNSASAGYNRTISVENGASVSVEGDFLLRNEYNNTSTLNVSGEVSVGGNFWIARDGKGIVYINEGGTVVANTLTFGQRWEDSAGTSKTSQVNVAEGGKLIAGSIVANTDRNVYQGVEDVDILKSSALNLNGGTLGTSADSMTIDVTSGNTALSVKLGAGTTSTINTGKYDTASKTFTDTEAAISIANVISGDGALKKAGAGTLTLSGNNTYRGGTVIEAGTVVAAHANALGTTKGVGVQSGATLNLGTSAVTVAGLSGAGTVGLADGTTSATLTVNGGGVFSGTLNGGSNLLALVFDADGQTLELNPAFSNTLSSVEIKAGTVKTGKSFALGYSDVSVKSSGALEVTTSTLTSDYGLMLGGITFADGSSFVVDVTGAAENDVLKIITSSVIKFNTGSEDVSLTSDNLDLFVNDFVTLKGWDGLADWAYDGSALSVTLTIPEPSTFGLLAGLGALALAGTRRRRKKA